MPKPSDVHVGEDGWLFWLSSAGHRATFYRNAYTRHPRTLWRVARWALRIRARAARCQALGARFVQVVAPDKLSVYADKTKGPLVDPEQGVAARLARLSRHVCDLRGPLIAARADGETYLKTDTHWTTHGHVAAYAALCLALGAEPSRHILSDRPDGVRFSGDLGRALDPPAAETTADHLRGPWLARRREENALVSLREARHGLDWAAGLMVGSRIVYANPDPGADPRRVVVFGDSYSFHHTGLARLLAESFSEVHALWSASMDWGYLRRVRPDLVIHETAERFTFMVEPDGRDVDAFAAARVREAEAPAG